VNIQLILENTIHKLVNEFVAEPYRFFTEADAVARFHEILEADVFLSQKARSKDGYLIPLVHQEYPTFFRFEDKNPTARLPDSSKAKRGHYDIAILNQRFIQTHDAETVKNRNYKTIRNKAIQPFEAVVEFKLDDKGWSTGRTRGAIAELGKLLLSRDEVELRYLVSLMRYTAPNQNRWKKYWPQVEQAAKERSEIRSIFVTSWLSTGQESEVSKVGDWCIEF
jgi:hypothetical protein